MVSNYVSKTAEKTYQECNVTETVAELFVFLFFGDVLLGLEAQ